MPKPLHKISKRHYNRLIAQDVKKLLVAAGINSNSNNTMSQSVNQNSEIPEVNLQEVNFTEVTEISGLENDNSYDERLDYYANDDNTYSSSDRESINEDKSILDIVTFEEYKPTPEELEDAQNRYNVPSVSKTSFSPNNNSSNSESLDAKIDRLEKKIDSMSRQSDRMEKKMDMILTTVTGFRKDQQKVVQLLRDPQPPEIFDLLPEFPLVDDVQLEELEIRCKLNENVAAQFRKKVLSIGGKDLSTCTRKVMASLFTNHSIVKYTWFGYKQNRRIKEYKMMGIIMDTISSTYNGTKDSVETVLKRWLHYTKDREKKVK